MVRLLLEAEAWARRTELAFDARVGALVDVWDLRGDGAVPSSEELASARAASGPAAISIDASASTVVRHSSSAWIDTGAFGKGAALRSAAALLKERGVSRALLDLGGQLWAKGSADEPWQVWVAHPSRRDEPAVELKVQNISLATSGTSERWVEVGGRRLGHILDPRTGTPAPAWGSVTVVSADPLEADILSTALFVMGPDAGLRWAQGLPEVGVLFLEDRGDTLEASWNPPMDQWFADLPQPDAGSIRRRIIH
jgi:thiamine biosynthesis lipoprotein